MLYVHGASNPTVGEKALTDNGFNNRELIFFLLFLLSRSVWLRTLQLLWFAVSLQVPLVGRFRMLQMELQQIYSLLFKKGFCL